MKNYSNNPNFLLFLSLFALVFITFDCYIEPTLIVNYIIAFLVALLFVLKLKKIKNKHFTDYVNFAITKSEGRDKVVEDFFLTLFYLLILFILQEAFQKPFLWSLMVLAIVLIPDKIKLYNLILEKRGESNKKYNLTKSLVIIILIVLLIFASYIYSFIAETIGTFPYKVGVVKDYYESGNIKIEWNYRHGKVNGVANQYFENGDLLGEWNYKNGQYDGLSKEYFDNGKLKGEWNFEEGKQQGITRKYYRDGTLRGEWNYKNGQLDGFTRKYYGNGQLRWEGNLEKGLQEGVVKGYYLSGNLEEERSYSNGKREGVIKQFYESGILKGEWSYSDGKRDGITKQYYESGKLNLEEVYKDAKLLDEQGELKNGEQKIYYENGNLHLFENYKNGIEEGIQKVYWKDGGLKQEWFYDNNELVSFKKFDKEGNIKADYKGNDIEAIEYNNQAYGIYVNGDNLEKGLELVEKALSIDAKNNFFLGTKAQLLYEMGEYEEANKYLQKAIKFESEPEHEEIKQLTEMIEYALEHFK